jgi:polysaccharide export outer membrane protein
VEDGDVVYVAKRSLPPIHVQGLVQRAGEFVFPIQQDLRLLDALALAGGTSNCMADKVLVIRQLPGQPSPAHIAASIDSAMSGPDNLLLAPGDMVIVERTVATTIVDVFNSVFHVGFGVNAGPTL